MEKLQEEVFEDVKKVEIKIFEKDGSVTIFPIYLDDWGMQHNVVKFNEYVETTQGSVYKIDIRKKK